MRLSGNGLANGNLAYSDGNNIRGKDLSTANDLTFMGGRSLTANASEYCHIGLRNPAASGVTIMIDRFEFYGDTEQYVYLRNGTISLTNETSWQPLLIQAGAGNGLTQSESNNSIQGTNMGLYRVLNDEVVGVTLPFPVMIEQGRILMLVAGTFQTMLGANFWGREVKL